MSESDQATATAGASSDLLNDAIRVLTAAARAGGDWAEFVSLACAGAAANIGGIDEVLAGRPGSWEASSVRDLLTSTVGDDGLWAHRTEPITIDLNVDDILSELGDADAYDDAAAELDRLADSAAVDIDQYAWTYWRTAEGLWRSSDPAAPQWSYALWIEGLAEQGVSDDDRAALEDAIVQPDWMGALLIAKRPGALREFTAAEAVRATVVDPFLAAIDRLEDQRVSEWRTYGQHLADRIRRIAPQVLPGLTVPVEVRVLVDDVAGHRYGTERDPLADRLYEAALGNPGIDPTRPANLPGTPLTRLGVTGANTD